MQSKYVAFGCLFGFILSRVGATNYDAIFGMFSLSDLHLVGVIGLAIAVNALGFFVVRRFRLRASSGEPIVLPKKTMSASVVVGGLLFGVGWALAGTCPGTALAQIGEGRLMGLLTFAGIVAGAYLAQRQSQRAEPRTQIEASPAE
jgi:hypothetical protein